MNNSNKIMTLLPNENYIETITQYIMNVKNIQNIIDMYQIKIKRRNTGNLTILENIQLSNSIEWIKNNIKNFMEKDWILFNEMCNNKDSNLYIYIDHYRKIKLKERNLIKLFGTLEHKKFIEILENFVS
jgi:hypothetical protein